MVKRNPLSQYPEFFVLYLDNLLNPWLWLEKADKLLEASEVLEPKLRKFWNIVHTNAREGRYNKGGLPPKKTPSELHGPYFILVSYALENLFKALIIRDQSDEIRGQFVQTGRLPSLIKGHDLVRLSKKANIKIDIKEEDVLTRLSRFSKWKSRYPVPVELSDMRNMLKYSNGNEYFADYFKPDDLDRLNAIVKRVKDRLKKQGYKGEAKRGFTLWGRPGEANNLGRGGT
jgi:hypothetical protein